MGNPDNVVSDVQSDLRYPLSVNLTQALLLMISRLSPTRSRRSAAGWLRALLPAVTMSLAGSPPPAAGQAATDLPQVQEFIVTLATRHGFERSTLRALFDQVVLRPENGSPPIRPGDC